MSHSLHYIQYINYLKEHHVQIMFSFYCIDGKKKASPHGYTTCMGVIDITLQYILI